MNNFLCVLLSGSEQEHWQRAGVANNWRWQRCTNPAAGSAVIAVHILIKRELAKHRPCPNCGSFPLVELPIARCPACLIALSDMRVLIRCGSLHQGGHAYHILEDEDVANNSRRVVWRQCGLGGTPPLSALLRVTYWRHEGTGGHVTMENIDAPEKGGDHSVI